MTYYCESDPNFLAHYGIPGMKWGRRKGYSTGIRSYVAKKKNEKVDKSFKKWEENDKLKTKAIEAGKKANISRLNYEKNKSDKQAKDTYRSDKKQYNQLLRKNTTYRKGVVRQDVGRDAARKYLSEAKKLNSKIKNNPNDKDLIKQQKMFMNKHDIERNKARKAVDVSTKRMNASRKMKTAMTKTVKGIAVSSAVGAGLYVVNKYALHGKYNINTNKIIDYAKKGKNLLGYIY